MSPLSPAYFAFAALVITLFWVCFRWQQARLSLLLAANLFFLARLAWFYPILLLAAASIDFLVGLGLQNIPRAQTPRRRVLVSVSVLLNVGLLASTKCIPVALIDLGPLYRWVFPLSLSFYCFQSMTYTIDLFRGTREGTRSYLTHLTSATLFTVIVAGPINRISDLVKQLQQPFSLTQTQAARAFLLISSGLFKKLLIADFLSNNIANRVFDTPTLYSGAEVLLGVYAYALQIYFDFSGYTDIAMGVSLLLGLTLPDNFNRPYQSLNIADFWRRWHITFSNWLRDYLYFSLPSSRKWKGWNYINPIIVMVLGGLWHGLGWTFFLWGLIHGIALTTHRIFQQIRQTKYGKRPATPMPRWARYLSIFVTFHFICFTWIFFRSPDVATAQSVLARLGSMTFSVTNITLPMLAVMIIGVALHAIPAKWFDRSVELFSQAPFVLQGAGLASVVLLIELLSGRGSTSFVYSNF
ncbi:MBOAT family protein [Granulicella sp. L60]|uniref:MBOAT family O-acyltransferase n=1 Tax=Granulicella sp. L60 TaxID=1641866 RepID=UPI00131B1DFA|nr:MBOAT family O-acyltransferase [Granulicella sp. L60]